MFNDVRCIGDEIVVQSRGSDGWCVGLNVSTGKIGSFPGVGIDPLLIQLIERLKAHDRLWLFFCWI